MKFQMTGLDKISTDSKVCKNKYFYWYVNLIERRLISPATGEYIENHHIFPRSFGGTDSRDNMVILTAREHLVCHMCLAKFTIANYQIKMKYALNAMMIRRDPISRENIKINSRLYAAIRQEISLLVSIRTREWFADGANRAKIEFRNEKISASFYNGMRDEYLAWLSNGGSAFNNAEIHKKTVESRTKNGTNIFILNNPMKTDGPAKLKKIEKTSGKNHYMYNRYIYYVSFDSGQNWECIGNKRDVLPFINERINISMAYFYNIMKDPDNIKSKKYKHLRFKKELSETKSN